MDTIYIITVMTELEKDELGWPHFGSTRTIGWLEELSDAKNAIRHNWGDIYETMYEYAVIEEVPPGFYRTGEFRQFFHYNPELGTYEEMNEPEWMKNFVNIGIG